MSLLKANSVQIGQSATATQNFTLSVPSSPDGTIKLARGNSGATTQDILSVNSSGAVTINNMSNQSFRNRIINGDMRIWQRATSYNMTASWAYGSVDRWICTSSPSASGFFNRSTSVPTGFQYSVQMGRTAASTVTSPIQCVQAIESVNCYGLQGQTVTLSFWARAGANFSSSGGILYSGFGTGTVADQAASSFYSWTGSTLQGQNNTLTTTWTRYTYTATIASDVLEVGIVFSYTPTGTAGADDSVYITGVQLEAGSTATEFERRPIGVEMMLCQRYCWRMSSASTTKIFFQGYMLHLGQLEGFVPFPVPMRTQPTMTSSPVSQFSLRIVNTVITALSLYATGGEFEPYTGVLLYTANPTTGNSVGVGQSLVSNSSTATFIQFNAEL